MDVLHTFPSKTEPTDQFSVARTRAARKLDITIVIIVSDVAAAEKEYSTALNSVRCYAQVQKYRLELVEHSEYRHLCQQENSVFRRHCIIGHLLRESDWILLLDVDSAVVNPKIRLEEFIDNNYDLTMYDKFINWEIATGSYIVKNTFWARDFLMKLAEFETKLPVFSDDNVALHMLIQKTFYPQFAEEVANCGKILEGSSATRAALYTFEACVRSVIGEDHEFDRMRILKKGTAWVRDIWLTDSTWSQERDFMLRGLRDAQKSTFGHGMLSNILLGSFTWRNPFLAPLKPDECQFSKWDFDPSLIVSKPEIDRFLTEKYEEVEKMRWKSLAAVGNYIKKD
ncbi:unnamed protein product [Caenorhabditis sp. 36 PRJEB53466]|nr:unnamed protein product [Caenorhabditis sp. 36 PRJEB53466]